MNRLLGFAPLPLLALAVVLCITGCPKDHALLAASDGQNNVQDQSSDPAAANLAQGGVNTAVPATYSTSGATQTTASYNGQQAAAANAGGSYDVGPDQDTSDPGYGAQPVYYASQPPPPLPEYNQPPAPDDGYMWTPGYWGYTSNGYYWVPGAWVEAPYEGALWTPGYWGYYHQRYGFYRGYWGPPYWLLWRRQLRLWLHRIRLRGRLLGWWAL